MGEHVTSSPDVSLNPVRKAVSSRIRLRRLRIRIATSWVAALCLLVLVGAGFTQNQQKPQNQQKTQKYYDQLADRTFRDVRDVVQLGMDFALTYKDRIDKEFAEWLAGLDPKTPDDNDYFNPMATLHRGWLLLLQSSNLYHQARLRQTEDAETRQLEAQAKSLRDQGIAKVKEADALKEVADKKRSARLRAEEQKRERDAEAARQQQTDRSRDLAGQFDRLNKEGQDEEDLHNSNIARIESSSAANRKSLLFKEDQRHERRMNEIGQKRNDLAKQLYGDVVNEPVRQDIAGGDKNADDDPSYVGRPEVVGGDKGAYDCYPLPPKKYVGCETTLANEKERWSREADENQRALTQENARNQQQMQILSRMKTPSSNPSQESDCHAKNVHQLEQESAALQNRYQQCVLKLTAPNRGRP